MPKRNDCMIDSASITATIDEELKLIREEMSKLTEILGELSSIIDEVKCGS